MIYVMAEVDIDGGYSPFVKIGYVTGATEQDALPWIRKRLNKLQTGNPRRLHVIGLTSGTRQDEKALHYRFQEHRIKRPAVCEWLHLRDGVSEWLATVRLPKPILFVPCVGVGARGGKPAPRRKNVNKCYKCGSKEHTRARCPLYPRPKREPKLPRKVRQTAEQPEATRIKRGQWVWRGRVRTSWTTETRRF